VSRRQKKRPPRPNEEHEFWVTNISTKKDISLADLRLTLRRGRSVNLLDKRHYSYTLEQLQESEKSGSIHKKRHVVKVRDVPPIKIGKRLEIEKNRRVLVPARNKVEMETPYYEELDFENETEAEEAFAAEEAEASFQDKAPLLAVDKKFKEPDPE
jgi:hypothetical protein